MKREGKRRVRASTLRVLSALGVAALVCLGLALHTGHRHAQLVRHRGHCGALPARRCRGGHCFENGCPAPAHRAGGGRSADAAVGPGLLRLGLSRPVVETGVSRKEGLEARCFFTGFRASRCPGVRARGLARFAQLGAGRGHPLDGCVRVPGVLPCVPGRFDVRNARRGVEGVPVQRGHLVASGDFQPCSCWSWQCCGNGAIGSVRWERCCRWCRAATARSGRRRTSGRACMRLTASAAIGAPTRARKASTCMIGPLRSSLNECVKCRECADACPVHAITFPFLSKKTLLEPSAAERDTKEEQ